MCISSQIRHLVAHLNKLQLVNIRIVILTFIATIDFKAMFTSANANFTIVKESFTSVDLFVTSTNANITSLITNLQVKVSSLQMKIIVYNGPFYKL